MCWSLFASINCTLIRTLFPERRTLPSRTVDTPSALPISRMFGAFPRYCITDVREITLRSPILDKFVRMSSWIPSAKYAFSFSSLRFSNGNTAIDLSILRAEEIRGRRKNPAIAETIAPVATSIIMLRRRFVLGIATLGVARMPWGVTSKAHARYLAPFHFLEEAIAHNKRLGLTGIIVQRRKYGHENEPLRSLYAIERSRCQSFS